MTISMVAALNPRGHFRDIPITDGYNATTGPLSIENAYRVNNADDSFVATCIASDLGGREDISMIGGYVSDSNHSMVFKIASNSTVRWMTPIPFSSSASNVSESKTKSMVLGCTGDSSGDLYVVTASNASTFDGMANTRQVGQFGLFLSKLSGTNGARYWTSALNCTNDGADDALDVTWDFDTNRVLIFGQMYAMAFPSVEKRPRLLRLEAGCGERLSALTDIVFAPASKTIASRVVVGDSHHIFVGYRSSVKVYNVEKTCNQTSCFSCYVSLFDISYLQRATVVTSDTYNCHGIALSVDRVTRYVVVYMDISMSTTPQNKFVLLQVYEVTQSDSGFFGLTLFGTGTLGTSYTSIGAVFIQNYQILVSGVTSTNITDNSIGFMSPQSFIGQLQIGSARESPWINDVKYLPRISNPNIEESRISGMTWSAKSSRVMVLTTTNEVPDGAIDAPTWLAATCK